MQDAPPPATHAPPTAVSAWARGSCVCSALPSGGAGLRSSIMGTRSLSDENFPRCTPGHHGAGVPTPVGREGRGAPSPTRHLGYPTAVGLRAGLWSPRPDVGLTRRVAAQSHGLRFCAHVCRGRPGGSGPTSWPRTSHFGGRLYSGDRHQPFATVALTAPWPPGAPSAPLTASSVAVA